MRQERYQLPEETMNVKELSELAKRSTRVVREWCKTGKVRSWKIDGKIVIDAHSVEEWFRKAEL